MDYMRPDIVALLRGSDSSYVRELIGMDPVAVFRWAVLRAAIRAMAVLREAGRLRAERAEKAAGRRGPRVAGERGTLSLLARSPCRCSGALIVPNRNSAPGCVIHSHHPLKAGSHVLVSSVGTTQGPEQLSGPPRELGPRSQPRGSI